MHVTPSKYHPQTTELPKPSSSSLPTLAVTQLSTKHYSLIASTCNQAPDSVAHQRIPCINQGSKALSEPQAFPLYLPGLSPFELPPQAAPEVFPCCTQLAGFPQVWFADSSPEPFLLPVSYFHFHFIFNINYTIGIYFQIIIIVCIIIYIPVPQKTARMTCRQSPHNLTARLRISQVSHYWLDLTRF